MSKVLLLDFASELNRGDAIMQQVFYDLSTSELKADSISVVSVYGPNQKFDDDKHFDLSSKYDVNIYPNLRKTGNLLNLDQKISRWQKIINIFNLACAFLQLMSLKIFGTFLFRRDQSEVLKTMVDADYVIWNGRNFRNRAGIGEIYDILCMTISPIMALIMQKKVFAIGVSIWPLRYKISRTWLKKILGKCDFVSVRESSSHNYAKEVLRLNNIRKDPDLSFQSMPLNFNDKTKKKIIFITLVDWKEDGSGVQEAYLNAVQSVIDWSISMNLEVKIVPQVFHEWEDFRSLVSQLKLPLSQVEVINENLDHEELMNLYRTGSFMLATRMHSAIFALSQGCKVICISYDSGAKWNILLDAGLKDKYLLKMQTLKSVDIVKKMNQLLNDSNYHDKIISSYKDNRFKVKEVFRDVLNHK